MIAWRRRHDDARRDGRRRRPDVPPISGRSRELAYELGGGKNVVNVALVDLRAWDTLGELSVLILAATGVASLVFVTGRADRVAVHPVAAAVAGGPGPAAPDEPSGDQPAGRRRHRRLACGRPAAPESLDHPRGGRPDPLPHRSSCSRSICCSPATTCPAAGSPGAHRGAGPRDALRRRRPLRAGGGRAHRCRKAAGRRHGDRDRVCRIVPLFFGGRRLLRARSSRPTCPSSVDIEFVTSTHLRHRRLPRGHRPRAGRAAQSRRRGRPAERSGERPTTGRPARAVSEVPTRERCNGRHDRQPGPPRSSWRSCSRAASTRCSSAASPGC